MTVKELKDIIENNNIPDDARIIVMADKGWHYEYGSTFVLTRDNLEECDDLEEAVFEFNNFMNDYYDNDALRNYPFDGSVTGIVILGN